MTEFCLPMKPPQPSPNKFSRREDFASIYTTEASGFFFCCCARLLFPIEALIPSRFGVKSVSRLSWIRGIRANAICLEERYSIVIRLAFVRSDLLRQMQLLL